MLKTTALNKINTGDHFLYENVLFQKLTSSKLVASYTPNNETLVLKINKSLIVTFKHEAEITIMDDDTT